MRRPHPHGTTPAQRTFDWNHAPLESRRHNGPFTEPRAARYHTRITSFDREPRASGITPCITGIQHNERSYHFCTTSFQHNERSYHFCTTSFQHNGPAYHTGTTGFGTTEPIERAFRKLDTPHPKQKRNANGLATGAERYAYQLPRARRQPPSKNQRSRARSGRLHRRVRRPDTLSGLPPACADHTIREPHRHNGCSVGTTHL